MDECPINVSPKYPMSTSQYIKFKKIAKNCYTIVKSVGSISL